MSGLDSHPKYRPDVDGLRAVAVLAVVGFHAFPGYFPGGFAGVDVFFVISGFLISTIIVGQVERGTFRIGDFYARRIKRIFPALALVLLACLALGWLLLLPPELEQLGKHVAAGAGFVSNLVLYREAGYFDTSAATKPLLHLWSLGIEEQFYVVWPVMLAGARARRVPLVIGLVGVASFALNLALVHEHASAAFYLPLTRFWELLIGAALAWMTLHPPEWWPRVQARARGWMAFAGLALMTAGLLLLRAEQAFPGWRALLPTVGTVLLIAAGPDAFPNRTLLAWRPMVAIGLVSFPLYLWHWPLLTFARILEAGTPPARARVIAVIVSFALAWLTYRFVEAPIRRRAPGARSPVPGLGLAVAGLFALGLATMQARGFPEARGPWNVTNLADAFTEADQFTPACRARETALYEPRFEPTLDFCHERRGPSAPIDAVVVGDSHAGRIYSGLLEASDLALVNFGRGSCLPFAEYEATNPGSEQSFRCSPTMGLVLARTEELAPRALVLNGFFVRPYDGRVVPRTPRPLESIMRDTLTRVAARIPKIVVVLDVPELPFDPSYCVDRPLRRGEGRGRCPFGRARAVDEPRARYESKLREAATGLPNVVFFDPAAVLCDAATCFAVEDRRLLYDDRHHLSRDGARRVGLALRDVLAH